MSRSRWAGAGVLVTGLLLAGCSASTTSSAPERHPEHDRTSQQPADRPDRHHESQHDDDAAGAKGKPHPSAPLREGERFVEVRMPAPYSPEAPTTGTDDYRCFLLNPRLTERAFVTGVDVVPGRGDLVHHVILFHVPPGQVAAAERRDDTTDGQGWTCFGGSGLATDPADELRSAPWLGAWAPGGGERLLGRDIGIPVDAGSRVVMQVHYNLLAGDGPDTSSARLRLADASAGLAALQTMLMPAPVELPCRAGHDGPLCDRDAAVRDVISRFGIQSGQTVSGLQFLCGGNVAEPKASPVQHCDRPVREPSTVRAVAGHMHLLGRSIKVELNPGRADARTLLDVPVWDFDDQGAVPLRRPAELTPGDVLRVTCRHDQSLRDKLPALKGQPERYVVWGEGTTDEMCLAIVMSTPAR